MQTHKDLKLLTFIKLQVNFRRMSNLDYLLRFGELLFQFPLTFLKVQADYRRENLEIFYQLQVAALVN